MEKPKFNKIISLQFLRAFACLSVLFTHVLQDLHIKPFGNYYVSGGYGVDLFFILSGFLIYLTTKNGESWKSFGIKRVFRIYPLYWLCVVLYFVWQISYFDKEYSLLYYLQNFLMLPWDGLLTTKSLVVGVAWSTVYEVYFYAVFTFLLLLKGQKKYVIPLLLILFIIFKITYKLNLLNLNENTTFQFFYSVTGFVHIVPFIFGILIAIYYQKPVIINAILNFKFRKVFFVLFHFVYFYFATFEYSVLISYPISLTMFFLYLNLDYIFQVDYSSMLSKFFIKMGDISFSIYLVHVLMLSLIIDYFKITDLLSVTILAYAMSIGVSIITYQFIESPFINLAKQILKSRKKEERNIASYTT